MLTKTQYVRQKSLSCMLYFASKSEKVLQGSYEAAAQLTAFIQDH